MKKLTIKLLMLSVLMAGAISCKKYDEGGSLGGADNKIVKTSWIIEQDTDLEDCSNITADYAGEILEFTQDREYKKNSVLKGTYTFSEDKLTLIILKIGGGSDVYKILKMKKKEMWLEELYEEELHWVPL